MASILHIVNSASRTLLFTLCSSINHRIIHVIYTMLTLNG